MSLKLSTRSSISWKPKNYQKRTVNFLKQHQYAGVFLEPGLGKTAIVLKTLSDLKKAGMKLKILLVAPLRVCYLVWPAEIQKWKEFNHLTYTILHGPDKEKNLEKDVDIYLINPEGLDWLLKPTKSRGTRGVKVNVDKKRFVKFGFTSLIIDEISKFKNYAAQRTKAINQITPYFYHRWGLTGSPAPNSLLELFSPMKIIDLGEALGEFITHYRNKYFHTLPGREYTYVLNMGAADEIYDAIRPKTISMQTKDYVELPAITENIINIELDRSARRIYDEMEENLWAEIQDNEVAAAPNAAVASSKCRQIANGTVYLQDLEVRALQVAPSRIKKSALVHEQKLEALVSLLEELQGQPLLCAYEFKSDLREILAAVPGARYIGGGTTAQESAEIQELWNAGELPLLLGHPASMGHGLNMQGSCANICWYGPTWSFELHDQFIRRVYRPGNPNDRVIVHYIVARDTIDELVYEVVHSREKAQNALFSYLKNKRR